MKRFENLKAVLFDLDGTLVNTLPGLTELVNQMRSDFDKPPLSEEKVGKYIGKGMFVLVRRAMTDSMDEPFPEEMFNLAVKSMARHVEAGRYSKGVLYPDTIETIKYVKKSGAKDSDRNEQALSNDTGYVGRQRTARTCGFGCGRRQCGKTQTVPRSAYLCL